MSKIVEVCYADEVYKEAQKWNVRFAKWFGGCKEVYAYNKESLPEEFLIKNERFFRYKRGGGYWVWKSYIINEVLKKIEYGEYLFYCDSGALIIRNLNKLVKVLERDNQEIMVFETCGLTDGEYSKRDIYTELECDFDEHSATTQRMSTAILVKKSEATEEFFRQYVDYCQRGMLITDEPNEGELPNHESFKENRHDQSVLSLLSKRWGIKAYRDPSQWGSIQKIQYKNHAFKYQGEYETYERSNYPRMIEQHRYKKINIHNILAHYYHYWKLYMKFKKNPYQ